jgi:hypothetical protein
MGYGSGFGVQDFEVTVFLVWGGLGLSIVRISMNMRNRRSIVDPTGTALTSG